MSAVIEKIKTYSAKGDPGTELNEAKLVENSGLEGDFHAKGGDRQISLLLAESREQIANPKDGAPNIPSPESTGLCFSRFKENISIRGLAHDDIGSGIRLKLGEAVLEISGTAKRCHEECQLFRAGKRCPLAGLNLFAKVLKSGVISAGGTAEILNKDGA